METENIEKAKKEKFVENCYQGIFVTETVLGNPNGSFVNNEPRNINGRVFTTDKCIKYNVRDYIQQRYEEIEYDEEKERVKNVENFVFFYPRLSKIATDYQASYLTKDSVFNMFFVELLKSSEEYREEMEQIKNEKDKKKQEQMRKQLNSKINNQAFRNLIKHSPDCRIFGGTFSFQEDNKQIYGPVQISYGLDLIGADIINLKLGTPFSTDDGKQKTTGEEHVVDHAVIGYDITVNSNHAPNLLKKGDLEMFKEGLIQGTNLRRSTSKKTEAKLLIMIKFNNGVSVNVGELKHLIEVKSKKITDPKETPKKLVLNMERVKQRLDQFKKQIEKIEVYRDKDSVKIEKFYQDQEGEGKVEIKSLNELKTVDEEDVGINEENIN